MGQNFAFWKKSDASFIISDESDIFQTAKFCPVLNIHNSADDQFFKFAWVANSMLTCTVSYPTIGIHAADQVSNF